MNNMTLAEFREHCKQKSDGLVDKWDFTKFKIICQKCKSEKIGLVFNEKSMGEGSHYTGPYTITREKILVKCMGCGHAMNIKGGY